MTDTTFNFNEWAIAKAAALEGAEPHEVFSALQQAYERGAAEIEAEIEAQIEGEIEGEIDDALYAAVDSERRRERALESAIANAPHSGRSAETLIRDAGKLEAYLLGHEPPAQYPAHPDVFAEFRITYPKTQGDPLGTRPLMRLRVLDTDGRWHEFQVAPIDGQPRVESAAHLLDHWRMFEEAKPKS